MNDNLSQNKIQRLLDKSRTPRLQSSNYNNKIGINGSQVDQSIISSRINNLSRVQKSQTNVVEKSIQSQNETNQLINNRQRQPRIDISLLKPEDNAPQQFGSFRSRVSGLSGLNPDSKKKSEIVSSHEQKIHLQKQRSGSRNQIAQNNYNINISEIQNSNNNCNFLQIGKQNKTDLSFDNQHTPIILQNQNNYSASDIKNIPVHQLNKKYLELKQQSQKNLPNSYQDMIGMKEVDQLKVYEQQSIFQQQFDIFSQKSQYQIKKKDQIHLAFLFASPLMLKTSDDNYYDFLEPISFSEEFQQIKQFIEEKKILFNYRYTVATAKNLLQALRENPIGLHFSGHGFQNNENLYHGDKKGWLRNKNKGDVLIFENENGTSEFFFESDLNEMILKVNKNFQKQIQLENQENKDELQNISQDFNQEKSDLQFVFVASCHSEKVGRIFFESGISHVICINQNQTILDKAAIEFSKYFYDEIFGNEQNICDAYTYARDKVEKNFGKFHAEKIMLLKNHDSQCPQQIDQRLKPKVGQMMQIGVNPEILFLPNKVSPFICRNQDMFDVLRLISSNYIVQIFGLPGFGKSSLLKNVTCFLGERDIYKNGVLYIDFIHVEIFREAIQIIHTYLKESNFSNDGYNYEFQQSFNQDDLNFELIKIKNKFAQFDKFLFSIDNIDHLHKGEHELFLKFLDEISSDQVKIIFTSTKFQMNLFGEKFSVKKLQKLKKYESIELFMKKIPLAEGDLKQFFDYENIEDLHSQTIKLYDKNSKNIPELCKLRHQHGNPCIQKYLQNHPIVELFGGIPLVISIIAPLSVQKSISEIFMFLYEKNNNQMEQGKDILKSKIDGDNLINCLEYCTEHFKQQQDNNILELWYLISTQGPGILYNSLKVISVTEDQDDIISQQKLDKNLEDLINFSLVESEGLDRAGNFKRFRVSPFVNTYIQRKMTTKMKKDFLFGVCSHLNTVFLEFKKEYALEIAKCKSQADIDQLQQQTQDKIKPYEQQVMHNVKQSMKWENVSNDDLEDSFEEDESLIDQDEIEQINSENKINSQKSQKDTDENSNVNPKIKTKKSDKVSSKASNHLSKINKKEIIPYVSDEVKWARSTIVLKLNVDHLQKSSTQCKKQSNHKNPQRSRLESQKMQGEKYRREKEYEESSFSLDKILQQNQESTINENSSQGINNQSIKTALQDDLYNNTQAITRPRILSDQKDLNGLLSPELMNNKNSFNKLQTQQIGSNNQKDSLEDFTLNQGSQRRDNINNNRVISKLGFQDQKDTFKSLVKIERDNILKKQLDSTNNGELEEQNEHQQEQNQSFGSDSDLSRESEENESQEQIQKGQIKENFFLDLQKQREEEDNKDIQESQNEQLRKHYHHVHLHNKQDLGNFENSVNPFEIAKALNQNICNCELEEFNNCIYNEKRLKDSSQENINIFEINKNRRQTSRTLKKIEALNYDFKNSSIGKMRMSLINNSLTKKNGSAIISALMNSNNPDLQSSDSKSNYEINNEKLWQKMEMDVISDISEAVSQSAPEKGQSNNKKSSIALAKLESDNQCSKKPIQKDLQLKPHEELFFHYLSILSLLQNRREELTYILFEQRMNEKDTSKIENSRFQKNSTFFDGVKNVVIKNQLKTMGSIVSIPDEAKLLKANTLMLELYVSILDRKRKKQIRFYDETFEKTNEIKQFFKEIQFFRGIAIINYIQAKIQLKVFKKIQKFKKQIWKSCFLFYQTHEIQGVQQCLKLAKQYLKCDLKSTQPQELQPEETKDISEKIDQQDTESNLQLIAEIQKIYQSMMDCKDVQIQNFINFRNETKIPNLAAKLVKLKDKNLISEGQGQSQQLDKQMNVDLVYNMLLNPQYSIKISSYNK